jgi:delta14-sterol reductase
MLSTWDIIAEKFGFMLVWGDLVLVPFFYSIVGWSLVDAIAPTSLSTISTTVAISLLYLVDLTIFRDANAQKHRFKKNPEAKIWGQPAQALEGKLLISGWWGIGRKLNYTGEICVYFALALTAGFDSIIPYLLPLWLCVLLPHRAWRDEQRCQAKYGNLWNSYCARVRFRMLPFMY